MPGFTTDMMNKLRADIIAGKPPAASQLKGPEIQAWSQIAPTVSMDDLVAAAGYEKVISPELAKLHKVKGQWVALPLQVHRLNTIYASKKSDGEDRRDGAAQDLGRVQRDGEEDEGRRHHAGGARRARRGPTRCTSTCR